MGKGAIQMVAVWLVLCGALFAGGMQKVVYHINDDDPKKQQVALRMMQHHIKGAEGNLDLRVILHGAGISMLLLPEHQGHTALKRGNAEGTIKEMVELLRQGGARFQACGISMEGLAVVPREDLLGVEQKDVVHNAMLELVRLQQEEGFAYIKP